MISRNFYAAQKREVSIQWTLRFFRCVFFKLKKEIFRVCEWANLRIDKRRSQVVEVRCGDKKTRKKFSRRFLKISTLHKNGKCPFNGHFPFLETPFLGLIQDKKRNVVETENANLMTIVQSTASTPIYPTHSMLTFASLTNLANRSVSSLI